MTYISTEQKYDKVYVWERVEGKRIVKQYKAPFYFFIESPVGEYKSIFNTKLKKIECSDHNEFNAQRAMYRSANIPMYESDLLPELRILSEHYYNTKAPDLHVTFLDIEVDYTPELGFANSENPYAPINSIALCHQWLNKMIVFAVPPEDQEWNSGDLLKKMNEVEPLPDDVSVTVKLFPSERHLLGALIEEIEDSDVLSGWNSSFFDLPYIAKRLERAFGEEGLSFLSFEGARKPKFKEVEKFKMKQTSIDIFGRISVDYMELYRKYEYGERPSYKLEAIADAVLPDLPKLNYKGALHDLYRKNFPWFVRYNLRDTEVLKGFEDRLGYVNLANHNVILSTGKWEHVLGTLKLAELAINNYCVHELGLRFPDKEEVIGGETISGAYVLDPKIGMHDWIGSIDINSLYPSAIRSINVSPETLIGQFDGDIRDAEHIANGTNDTLTLVYENGKAESHTAKEWREILWNRKESVSGYGTVFNQTHKGIIPAILEMWYTTRKSYQKLKAQEKDKIKKAYYDRLQYVYKIKLNSLYGALTNSFFRYYDLRMGESTTCTGRAILRHQCSEVNRLLTGKYDYTGEAIVGGDTDSAYFKTWANNEEEAVLVADTCAERVNNTFQNFMRKTFLCQPEFDNIIKAGRENVASRGIFVKKKHYILRVVDSEGDKVDKLKIMGLQIKKTTLPPKVGKDLSNFIGRLLRGEDWHTIAEDIVAYKEMLETTDDVSLIGLPKGVKKVESYTADYKADRKCRLPGHVAAAIHYNICREQHKDYESPAIMSGMKIRVFYITEKRENKFISVALPTDLEVIPEWFKTEFKIDRKKHIIRLVDMPLENILSAIGKDVPSAQSLLLDDLLVFDEPDIIKENVNTLRETLNDDIDEEEY